MYRYVALYNYRSNPSYMDDSTIREINELFKTDSNMNPMINNVFHECVAKRFWDDVPVELDKKIKGWNWFLKDNNYGYVEILSEEPLTQEELDIMAQETEGQISDGYNENPFEFDVNGILYEISFDVYPTQEFAEA